MVNPVYGTLVALICSLEYGLRMGVRVIRGSRIIRFIRVIRVIRIIRGVRVIGLLGLFL